MGPRWVAGLTSLVIVIAIPRARILVSATFRMLLALIRLDRSSLTMLNHMSPAQIAVVLGLITDASETAILPRRVLAVDIGGTRTKFMIEERDEKKASQTILAPMQSSALWRHFDPSTVPATIAAHVTPTAKPTSFHNVVFSVPGTVEIDAIDSEDASVVRNMPSFSPQFRGFDFKHTFRSVFPHAKISVVSDNMAAALGVAFERRQLQNALVICLGTAPAVATFFRDPHAYQTKDKHIETGIWQPWVWFSKIELTDPYGYCGGLRVSEGGRKITLKPSSSHKIPHRQARIRFALDNATWQRLRGTNPDLPPELQAFLNEEEATKVWSCRLQSSINVLCQKFHSVYGPPEEVWVVGGNATRCHGRVTEATYLVPDSTRHIPHSVPVVIPATDSAQQRILLQGLTFSTSFKVKQVFAPGQDPLARGWTRGGEIYVWAKRKELQKAHVDLHGAPSVTVLNG